MLNPPGQKTGSITIQVDPSSSFWGTLTPSTTPVAIGSLGGSNILDFATGAYQSALVTNALTLLPPTNGTHGARLEVWLKADGGGQTLNFDAAIVRPSESGIIYPKTLGTNLTYIILLRNSSNVWWLTSLVGGWSQSDNCSTP